jgi:retinol dehydrogenase 12
MASPPNPPAFFYTQLFVHPRLPKTSFQGKTIVITGANRGLGLEATRQFARLGASKIIMGVRNISRGEAAKADIEKTEKCPPSTIDLRLLDMASYESVKKFAENLSSLARVDALIASAGMMPHEFKLAEGHEESVTINVISTFLLAFLALPKLKETASRFNTRPHLTIISSEVHGWTKFAVGKNTRIFDALDQKSKVDMFRYNDTKLMEILIFRELFRSVVKSPETYPVTINIVNPGFCKTEFADGTGLFLSILKSLIGRRADVGSRTYIHAASVGAQGQGKYLSDCAVATESPFVRSEDGKATGQRLWGELKEILEKIQPGVTGLI